MDIVIFILSMDDDVYDCEMVLDDGQNGTCPFFYWHNTVITIYLQVKNTNIRLGYQKYKLSRCHLSK